jgi:predicted enzyme related to lactoylglutathione lyase
VTLTVEAVDFDCGDPAAVGRFWAAALGRELEVDGEGVYYLEAGDSGPEMIFISVPEGKAVKNRVHLDLRPDDQDAEVERLLGLGARRVDIGQTGQETWVVLADPEGNEFCVLRSRSGS